MAPAVAYAMEDDARYSKDEYFEYELTRSGYKVKKLTDKGKDLLWENDFTLTIPEYHNDIPVIGLAKNSLENEKIKTLYIPKTLKEIDDFALYKDNKEDEYKLEEIKIYPGLRDKETDEIIEQKIDLDRIGKKAIENQNLKELPFNVKEIDYQALKNNKFNKLDLSDTEIIKEDSITQEDELELIINKYSDVEIPFYDEEKTKVEYIEKEFNKKEQNSETIDYVKLRQELVDNMINNKKQEEENTQEEDDEEGEEDKPVEKEENTDTPKKKEKEDKSVEENTEYIPNQKHKEEQEKELKQQDEEILKGFDYDIKDYKIVEPKKLNNKEYKELIKTNKTPKRLSFNLFSTSYAAEDTEEGYVNGTKIEKLETLWLLDNDTTSSDDQTLVWEDDYDKYVKTITNYSLSGDFDYEPGTIQITIPKYIFEDRYGNKTGRMTLGVPEAPSRKNDFAYVETEDSYILINTKKLPAATQGFFTATVRDLKPHMIKDKVTEYETTPFNSTINVVTREGEVINKKSEDLIAEVDTREVLTETVKRGQELFESYPNNWPKELKPENDEDYIYAAWSTWTVNKGSQTFKIDFEDNAKTNEVNKNAEILGVRRNSDMEIFTNDNKDNIKVNNFYPTEGFGYVEDGNNFRATVYTAYPKSDFYNDDGTPKKDKYIIENNVKYTLTSEDDKEVTVKDDTAELEYLPKAFPVPDNKFKIFKEGARNTNRRKGSKHIGEYEFDVNTLLRKEEVEIDYNIEKSISAKALTKGKNLKPFGPRAFGKESYTTSLTDEEIYFNGDENTHGSKLNSDDYEFTKLTINKPTFYEYKRENNEWYGYRTVPNNTNTDPTKIYKNEWAFISIDRPKSEFKATLYDNNKTALANIIYTKDGDYTITAINDNVTVNGNTITLPENTTGYKIVTNTKEAGFNWHITPSVKIKPTDNIVKAITNRFGLEYDEENQDIKVKTSEIELFFDNKANLKVIKEDKEYFNEDDWGRDSLSGRYYSHSQPTGHFIMHKGGDGKIVNVNGEEVDLAEGIDHGNPSLFLKDHKDVHKRGIYPLDLNKLRNGKEVEVFYEVENIGFGMPWTYDAETNAKIHQKNPKDPIKTYYDEAFGVHSYRMKSRDFKLQFSNQNNEKQEELTNRDYEFTKMKFDRPVMFDYVKFDKDEYAHFESNKERFGGVIVYGLVKKGEYGYKVNEDYTKIPILEVFASTDNEKSYKKIADVTFNETGYTINVVEGSGAKADGEYLIFPDNTSDYKVEAETKMAAMDFHQIPYVKIKPTKEVVSMVEKLYTGDGSSDMPFVELHNTADLNVDVKGSKLIIHDLSTNDFTVETLDEDKEMSINEETGIDKITGIQYQDTPIGDHFNISKEINGGKYQKDDFDDPYALYSMYLNKIMNGDNAEISYKVNNTGFGMPFTYDKESKDDYENNFNKVPYKMVSRDYLVDFNTEKLDSKDFEFSSIKFNMPNLYDYGVFTGRRKAYYESAINRKYFNRLGGDLSYGYVNKGEEGYKATDDYSKAPDLEVYGKTDDGDYQKYATVSFKTGKPVVEATNGAKSKDDTLVFPDNITEYKVEAKTTVAGIRFTYEPNVRFKKSEKMEGIIDKLYNNDFPKAKTTNTVDLNVETYGKNNFIKKDDAYSVLDGIVYGANVEKSLKYENDAENKKVHLTYTSKRTVQTNIKNNNDLQYAIGTGGYKEEKEATWYDLLPKGVKADTSSIRLSEGARLKNRPRVIENYKNSGQDLLIVDVVIDKPQYSFTSEEKSFTNHAGIKDTHSMTFNASYTWQSLYDLGKDLKNHVVYESHNEYLGNMKKLMGEPDNPTYGNNSTSLLKVTDEKTKKLLTDLNEKHDNPSFVYGSTQNYVDIDSSGSTGLTKEVDVDNQNNFGTGLDEATPKNVYENQVYEYRKTIQNDLSTKSKNIVLYDKLEGYNPSESQDDYKDEQWRGTLIDVDVSQLKDRGIDAVVYYSTKKNIKLDDTNDRRDNNIDNTRIWTTERPENVRDITAIAIDARKLTTGKDFVLEKGQSFSYFIKMRAPDLNKLGYAKNEDDKQQWYDTARDIVDRKDIVIPGLGKEYIRTHNIYESEKGFVGGAHAYNNAVAILTSIDANTGGMSDNMLIRYDYTKVGLKPYVVNVEKFFTDDNNRDGIRPDNVKINLLANGKVVDSKVLNGDNKWKATFRPTLYDENGELIDYTLEEEPTKGYNSKISKDKKAEYSRDVEFNNNHNPAKVNIPVKKVWKDIDANHEAMPKAITYVLKADGKEVDRATVKPDKDGSWDYTFENLFKYRDGGVEIKYTIEEEPVEDFITTVDKNTITNTYYPYADLEVSKKVENASNKALDKEFTFVFELEKDKNDDRVIGDYKYEKYDAKGNPIDLGNKNILTNGSEFTLKDGERAVIKDIDARFKYKVTEKGTDAFVVNGNTREGEITTSETQKAQFVNKYQTKGETSFDVNKILDGRELSLNQFKFEVYEKVDGELIHKENLDKKSTDSDKAYNGINSNSNTILPLVKYTNVDLGYDKNGILNETNTKEYVIKEFNDEKDGYTYDDKEIAVKVVLTDNGNGNINTEVSYGRFIENIFNKDDVKTFKNEYRAEDSVNLKAFKYVKDGIDIKENQFKFEAKQVAILDNKLIKNDVKNDTFEFDNLSKYEYIESDEVSNNKDVIKSSDNGKVVANGFSDKDGQVDLSTINYNQYDAGKTFVYDVYEVDNSEKDENVVFDKNTIRYFIRVDDYGTGSLNVWTEFNIRYILDKDLEKAKKEAIRIVENYKLSNSDELISEIEKIEDVKELEDFVYNLDDKTPLFTNEYKPGNLKITKKVTDRSNKNEPFKFKIKLNSEDSEVPDGDFELEDNSPKTSPIEWDVSEDGVMTVRPSIPGTVGTFDHLKFYLINDQVNIWEPKDDSEKKDIIESLVSNLEFYKNIEAKYKDADIFQSILVHEKAIKFLKDNDFDVIKETIKKSNEWRDAIGTSDKVEFEGDFVLPEDSSYMFYNSQIPELNLSNFDTSSVTNMSYMFGQSGVTTLDLSNFDTSNVTDMSSMFYDSNATSLDLSNFDTSNVTNMSGMFNGSQATEIKLDDKFNTSNVTDMSIMFARSQAISLDLSNFDTSNVTGMSGMFNDSQATEIKLDDKFNTSNVTNMSYMFGQSRVITLDLSNFDTSNVTDMSHMFGQSGVTSLDLSNFDTSNVTDMSGMFMKSQAISLDLSNFNTSNVTDMSNMFYYSKATTLDLSSFDTSKVTNMDSMLSDIYADTVYVRDEEEKEKYINSGGLRTYENIIIKNSNTIAQNNILNNIKETVLPTSYAAETTEENTSTKGITQSTNTIEVKGKEEPVWSVTNNTKEYTEITFYNKVLKPKYTLNPNGGKSQSAENPVVEEIPTKDNSYGFFRPGYTFKGWGIDKDETNTAEEIEAYTNEQKEQGNYDIELFAIWEEQKLDFKDGEAEFTLYPDQSITLPDLPANMNYEIYEYTKDGWQQISIETLVEDEKIKDKTDGSGTIESQKTTEVVFTNDESPDETREVIRGRKTLNGERLNTEGYTFSLYEADKEGNITNDKAIRKSTSNKDGDFEFEKIIFNKVDDDSNDKDYYYIIKENNDNKENIIYTEKEQLVKITVKTIKTETGKRVITSKLSYINDDKEEDETYKPNFNNKTEKTKITITKDFEDDYAKEIAESKNIEFTAEVQISGERETRIVTLNKDNGFTATIDNLEIGTNYTVKEIDIPTGFKEESISNDNNTLKKDNNNVVITNSYKSDGYVELSLNKELIGRQLQSEEFTFNLYDEENNLLSSTSNEEDGEIYFYFPVDKAGERTFTIKESETKDTTIENDKEDIVVTVNLKDDGKGNIVQERSEDGKAKITYKDNKTKFVNKVKPGNLQLTKTVSNLDTKQLFTLKVELYDKNDKEITKEFDYTSTNEDNKGKIKSGDLISIQGDETITIENLPNGTRYVVNEVEIPDRYKLINKPETEGVIKTNEVNKVDFVNEYDSKGSYQIKGIKHYNKDLEDNQFEFYLIDKNQKDADGNTLILDKAYNDKDGNFWFDPIEFNKDDIGGLNRKLKVIERQSNESNIIYDKTVYDIELETIEDNGNILVKPIIKSNFKNKDSIEFTNEYKENLKSITIRKEVVNSDLADVEFKVNVSLIYPDGQTKEFPLTLKNNEEFELRDIPEGTEYTVKEVDIPEEYEFESITPNDTGKVEDDSIEVVVKNRLKGKKRFKVEASKLVNNYISDDVFEFNLLDEDGEVLQTKENVNKTITFDEIELDENFEGEKTYFVKEVIGDVENITYDEREYKVVVKNTKDDVEVKYYLDDKEVDEIIFNNIKTYKGSLELEANKTLNGFKPKDNTFTFELTDEDKKQVKETKNDKDGKVKFDIDFNEQTIKDYEQLKEFGYTTQVYYVKEVNDKQEGVLYDQNEYKITLDLELDNDTISIKNKTITLEDEEVESITFNNIKSNLPNTGKTTQLLTILGIILMILTTVGYMQTKKRRV